jgi:hypothetical protein
LTHPSPSAPICRASRSMPPPDPPEPICRNLSSILVRPATKDSLENQVLFTVELRHIESAPRHPMPNCRQTDLHCTFPQGIVGESEFGIERELRPIWTRGLQKESPKLTRPTPNWRQSGTDSTSTWRSIRWCFLGGGIERDLTWTDKEGNGRRYWARYNEQLWSHGRGIMKRQDAVKLDA